LPIITPVIDQSPVSWFSHFLSPFDNVDLKPASRAKALSSLALCLSSRAINLGSFEIKIEGRKKWLGISLVRALSFVVAK
jgi:hypothetical protein